MKPRSEAHGEICETDPCPTCDAIGSGLAAVAQSLINISEGLTTIEHGSRLEAGMARLMEPEVAALLRAAPDMQRALGAFLRAVDGVKVGAGERFHLTTTLVDDARAALAKARGQ
jgi:hypothetical protein